MTDEGLGYCPECEGRTWWGKSACLSCGWHLPGSNLHHADFAIDPKCKWCVIGVWKTFDDIVDRAAKTMKAFGDTWLEAERAEFDRIVEGL